MFLSPTEDIVRLNTQVEELKDYLNRIEKRIDTTYADMGHVRENMATRDDLNRLREVMITSNDLDKLSKDVDRLWKLQWIYLTAIIGMLITLIYYLLLK